MIFEVRRWRLNVGGSSLRGPSFPLHVPVPLAEGRAGSHHLSQSVSDEQHLSRRWSPAHGVPASESESPAP